MLKAKPKMVTGQIRMENSKTDDKGMYSKLLKIFLYSLHVQEELVKLFVCAKF